MMLLLWHLKMAPAWINFPDRIRTLIIEVDFSWSLIIFVTNSLKDYATHEKKRI